MSQEYRDYCNANFSPEDVPEPECPQCGGSGWTVVTVDNCDYETIACPNHFHHPENKAPISS